MKTTLAHTMAGTLGLLLLTGAAALLLVAPAAWAGPADSAPAAAPCPQAAPCPPKCECYKCECKKPAKPKCPPKYDNLRFRENWRPCLCVPCRDRGDWTDAFKAWRPRNRGRIWLNAGGQLRLRFESFNNIGFGAPADPDDDWVLLRIRAHADIHFGDHFRVFVEGIYADHGIRDLGPRPIDENEGDLLNAFAEVHGNLGRGVKAGLRAGRHELQLGKQRLISPLDWGNTRRTFQGASAWVEKGPHRVDAFLVRPVTVDGKHFDECNDDVSFWGLYYSNQTWTCFTWEAYVLGLHRDRAVYSGRAASEDRYTVGGRVNGKIEGTRFDYDAEAAWQFGDHGAGSIGAGFASAEFGWKPCTRCLDPRLAVGLDWASGDDNAADLDVGTFNQLFPLGHAYFGFADVLGRQNLMSARLTATVKPADKLTIRADYHGFWRADEADAAYNVGGGVLRAPAGVGNRHIGSELDLTFKWAIDRHWRVTGGWAHFFPGSYIGRTGRSSDIDFFYLETQVTL